nr:tetratricopeptide repeat protein [Rhodoferax sp.]
MQFSSLSQRAAKWLLVATLMGAGLAMAQAEPTLNEVYATAHAGKLDQAQVMIQQVLVGHPKSAKAHFVRAELYARQGDLDHARESLATADKLSPGLSFAKPDAVQALRTQLAGRNAARAANGPVNSNAATAADAGNTRPVQYSNPQPASSSWALPLLLAGGAIVAGYFIFRRRVPAPAPQAAGYGLQQGGLNGPQTFGMGGGGGTAPAGYPPAGGYPQPASSGLGGRIMGGVATGLAVGAGVMAAEAIGRNLMGRNNNADAGQLNNGAHNNDFQPVGNNNPDMGGADFGVNDGGSWDSGGGSDGGGDWDN